MMRASSEGANKLSVGDIVADKYDTWEQRVTDSGAQIRDQMHNAVEHNHYTAHQSLGDQVSHHASPPATPTAPPATTPATTPASSPVTPLSALTQALGSAISATPPAVIIPSPGSPVSPPDPSRFGMFGRNREQALNMVNGDKPAGKSSKAAEKPLSAGSKKGETASSKLGSVLGRALSKSEQTKPLSAGAKPDGKTTAPPNSKAAQRSAQDPMGSVASGTTMRRWRYKRKVSAEEIAAMEKLDPLSNE